MLERWDKLQQFRITMPELNAATIAAGLRFMALIVGAAGLVWVVANLAEKWGGRGAKRAESGD
jgi:hypothetical protein